MKGLIAMARARKQKNATQARNENATKPPQMPDDENKIPVPQQAIDDAANQVAADANAPNFDRANQTDREGMNNKPPEEPDMIQKLNVSELGQRPQPPKEPKQIVVKHFKIDALASDVAGLHIPAHIELRLSVAAREGMRLLMGGCINSLKGVDSRNKVLSWLLEQVVEQANKSGSSGSSGSSGKSKQS